MIVTSTKNIKLRDFQFWGGAIKKAQQLTPHELDKIEKILSESRPRGMADVEINGLFWFEFSRVCEWLGLEYKDHKIIR